MTIVHHTLVLLIYLVFGLMVLDTLFFFCLVVRQLLLPGKVKVGSFADEATQVWISRVRKVWKTCYLTLLIIVVLLFANEGLRHILMHHNQQLNKTRQPTPGVRLAAYRAPLARRGCALDVGHNLRSACRSTDRNF